MKKIVLVFITLLLLVSCQKIEKQSIITSFYPIQSLLESLTGEKYPAVMKGDAHDFELSPQERAAIAEADYFFYHGHGLEYWFDEDMMKKDGKGIALAQNVSTINGDPHTWLDPRNALSYIDVISEETNLNLQYEKEVRETLLEIIDDYDELFQTKTNSVMMVDHMAYSYLADRYNIKQEPIISGVSEGEASFKEVIQSIEKIKEQEISVLFVDPQHPQDIVKKIQKETGVKLLPLHTMESDPGMSYLEALRANYESLKEGLTVNDSN